MSAKKNLKPLLVQIFFFISSDQKKSKKRNDKIFNKTEIKWCVRKKGGYRDTPNYTKKKS